jgi:hypothetical protein
MDTDCLLGHGLFVGTRIDTDGHGFDWDTDGHGLFVGTRIDTDGHGFDWDTDGHGLDG